MRQKPDGVADALWQAFEQWAETHGISEHPEDWEFFWTRYHQGAQDGLKLATRNGVAI